uniref:Uncharacterized protein n=1 Tax=Panthera leo TaxID=9689 RepID=A0A8C8WLS8_PANLE
MQRLVPHSGSSYLYSYVTVGELGAFITVWNLLLINTVYVSIVTQAWILVFDNVFGNQIFQMLHDSISLNVSRVFADVLVFFVVFLVLLFIGFLTWKIRQLPVVTKVFTLMKIIVLIFVIIAGFIKGDLHNWQLTEEDYIKAGLNDTSGLGPLGSGGFMPFGFQGILHGAATCLYTFALWRDSRKQKKYEGADLKPDQRNSAAPIQLGLTQPHKPDLQLLVPWACYSSLIPKSPSTLVRMLCQAFHRFGQNLVHRRNLEPLTTVTDSARSLNTLDLVVMSVGHTVGIGVYILAGEVARDKAGPSILIYLLVAGLYSVLAVL